LLGVALGGAALAQTGGYDLSWFKAAPGGASSGAAEGAYRLDGGFLAGAPPAQATPGQFGVDLPLIRKQ
jgi:hypothetical protein